MHLRRRSIRVAGMCSSADRTAATRPVACAHLKRACQTGISWGRRFSQASSHRSASSYEPTRDRQVGPPEPDSIIVRGRRRGLIEERADRVDRNLFLRVSSLESRAQLDRPLRRALAFLFRWSQRNSTNRSASSIRPCRP